LNADIEGKERPSIPPEAVVAGRAHQNSGALERHRGAKAVMRCQCWRTDTQLKGGVWSKEKETF